MSCIIMHPAYATIKDTLRAFVSDPLQRQEQARLITNDLISHGIISGEIVRGSPARPTEKVPA